MISYVMIISFIFVYTLYEKANNPELTQMIKDLWLKVGPVFTGLFDDNYYRDHANDEHELILAAFRAGDAAAAQCFMQQDINIAAEVLLPLMPQEDMN